MGISSSMNAGVSGLNANANKLATISDNIANSQTYGYKRADVDFAAIAIGDKRTPYTTNGSSRYTAGGVVTNAIWDIEGKGGLTTTTNPTDLAISGRGMLPVTNIAAATGGTGDLPFALTSTGSFFPDESGYLTTPSGMVLLGWPADLNGVVAPQPRDSTAGLVPIQINRAALSALPTSRITMNANLPATDTQSDASGAMLPISVEYFDNLGASQTLSFEFTPMVPAVGMPQTNSWSLQITDQASGLSAGTYDIVFSDTPPTAGGLGSVTQTAPGTAPLSTAYDGTTGEITVGLGTQTINVGIGATAVGGPQHLSQLSSTFSPVGVSKDGSPAGIYSGIGIDGNGNLTALYSTGFSRVIYKVPVADVPNMNGLQVNDNQTFTVTRSSGPMYLWDAGDGPTGGIQGFARELSTTDIANELTQLIQTQRAYSSNAKIIQTVDEMLQETTNLKR